MITLQMVLHGGSKRSDVGDRGVVFRGACFHFWTQYHFLKEDSACGENGRLDMERQNHIEYEENYMHRYVLSFTFQYVNSPAR